MSMLTENIAKDAVSLLSEQMLYIVNTSVNSVKKTRTEQFQRASALWTCVKKEFQATEVARNIVVDLETTPECEIVQAIFRHQLSTHFKKDDDFAWDVEQVLYVSSFKVRPKTLIRKRVVSVQGNNTEISKQQNNQQASPLPPMPTPSQNNEASQDAQHSGD